MTRPAFTPGEGGGKPKKPKSETAWDFPWLVPQPQPEPESEPEVTSVTPMVTLVTNKPQPPESHHDYADPPASQSGGQASRSESDEQGSKGSSQKDDVPDAEHGKDETGRAGSAAGL